MRKGCYCVHTITHKGLVEKVRPKGSPKATAESPPVHVNPPAVLPHPPGRLPLRSRLVRDPAPPNPIKNILRLPDLSPRRQSAFNRLQVSNQMKSNCTALDNRSRRNLQCDSEDACALRIAPSLRKQSWSEEAPLGGAWGRGPFPLCRFRGSKRQKDRRRAHYERGRG